MTDDNPRDVLVDVFATHEHLVPSTDAALADLDTALISRHRTRRGVLAAGGAAVAVAAVAVGVTAASSGSARHGSTAAHGANIAPSSTTSQTVSTTATPQRPALPGPLTFAPGWLPSAAARQTNYEISTGEQYRGYDMSALGTNDLYVAITLDQHGSLGGSGKRNSERNLTVDGHPAHESVQTGSYQLDVDLGSGRLMHVVIQDAAADQTADGVSPVTPQQLGTAGRHIASDVDFGAHDTVHPPLVVNDLPSTLQITGVRLNDEVNNSVEDTMATDYTLATGPHAKDAVYISIARGGRTPYFAPSAPGKAGSAAPGRHVHAVPGRPVHGHPSLITRSAEAVELVVQNFAPGRELILIGRTDTVTLADLYRIADGLTWTG